MPGPTAPGLWEVTRAGPLPRNTPTLLSGPSPVTACSTPVLMPKGHKCHDSTAMHHTLPVKAAQGEGTAGTLATKSFTAAPAPKTRSPLQAGQEQVPPGARRQDVTSCQQDTTDPTHGG